jgi:hypothetical protein
MEEVLKLKKRKGTGRPKRSELTRKDKLNRLRTKSWVRSCACTQSDSLNNHLSFNALARAANAFSARKGKAETSHAIGWSRWYRGKNSAMPKTVVNLWPETIGAYRIGPWEHGTDKRHICYIDDTGDTRFSIAPHPVGGFVPLWSAVSGDKKEILQAWKEIPIESWIAWAPADSDYPDGADHEYVPEEIRKIEQIEELSEIMVMGEKQLPPLLALTASLTFARLIGRDKAIFFSSENTISGNKLDNYLAAEMRKPVFEALSLQNISFEELKEVCGSFGLIIKDGMDLMEQIENTGLLEELRDISRSLSDFP